LVVFTTVQNLVKIHVAVLTICKLSYFTRMRIHASFFGGVGFDPLYGKAYQPSKGAWKRVT